jgi:glycosyltransferase involved in cell wall biosynthesis
VEALIGQDYPADQYELLFVDNGSSDDSVEILNRYPEVNVLHEPVRGSYAARNLGLAEARGEIIAFTDSDCFPLPGWLSRIEEGFHSSNSLILMGPRLPPSEHRSIRLLLDYDNLKNQYIFSSSDPSIYGGHTNNMAVRKTVFDEFGNFVQRDRGADAIFVQEVVKAQSCDSVRWCEDMTVIHAEFASAAAYFSKVRTYGRSYSAFRHITPIRPLTLKERMEVFRNTVSQHPVRDSAWLISLLITGQFAWWLGGLGVARSDH